jgi:hypothetical protein
MLHICYDPAPGCLKQRKLSLAVPHVADDLAERVEAGRGEVAGCCYILKPAAEPQVNSKRESKQQSQRQTL